MRLPSRLSLFEITSHFLSFFFLQLPLPSGGFSLCSHLCSSVPVPSLRILPCALLRGWPRSLFCVTWSWLVSLLSAMFVHLACASLPSGLYFRPFSSFCLASLRFFFSSTLLPRSDLSSFAMGSPFGPNQLLRWVPSPPSPDLFWVFVR